MNKLKDTEEI